MVQFGDKHRGHTIDGRTTFLVDRGQNDEWVKLLDHHLSTTVRQTVHRGEYHTEAMEKRHTDTEFVVLREAHVLTREISVVGNTVMRQHHTLGEACCS